jgi:hypothetical protein
MWKCFGFRYAAPGYAPGIAGWRIKRRGARQVSVFLLLRIRAEKRK